MTDVSAVPGGDATHPPGLLSAILASAIDYAIMATDLEGRINFWNEGAHRIFGWSRVDVEGLPLDVIFTPADRANGVPVAEKRKAVESGRAADDRWHVRKDGGRFWARGEMLPLFDESGTRIGYLKVVRDRTVERQAERERREAAREAEESQATLRLAVAAGRMAVFHLDLETDVLEGSPELNEILGFPRDSSPPAEEVRRCFYPGERERLRELADRQGFPIEPFVEAEFRFVRPDDRRVQWLWLRAEVRRDAAGKPRKYLGVLFDVSQRKEAEEARRASEDRLRLAIEAGRMAVWDYDVATEAVTGSPELNRLLGVGPDHELRIEEIRARYHPEDLKRIQEGMAREIAEGQRFVQAEYRYVWPDGTRRWHLLRAEAIYFEANPVKLVGIVIDITDRKEIEEALRQREEDLHAALAAGSLAMYTFDNVNRELTSTPRLNEIFAYPADLALTLDDLAARYHPEDLDLIAQQFSTVSQPEIRTFEMEFRLLMPDGTVRWISARGEYLRDDQGRAHQSRGIITDVTDRKLWEERQRLLIGELNHRVKNTLAVIQAIAQQTFRDDDIEKARAVFAARIAALANAHDVLTRENWEGGELGEVVRAALHPFADAGDDRFTVKGPAVHLSPKAVLSVSLAVHELATNAVKHGALGVHLGSVQIVWRLEGDRTCPRVVLTWQERGGPPVSAPGRKGFGSRLIERGLAAELDAEVEIDYRPEGLVCHVNFALLQENSETTA